MQAALEKLGLSYPRPGLEAGFPGSKGPKYRGLNRVSIGLLLKGSIRATIRILQYRGLNNYLW